eukprot:CAMPEP_0115011148 /NCGR_PEP_ID=MMETSP0216-20121206/23799_1 /TAXON_ID=223996 /ORGANISM="Protocruzia adherens, Strain Boccale" /LENGTH=212 /DNA_ID=CAMNT_0002379619 /DNA_START=36 /DNA_END=674 /DNA_ORIENTATION=-
MATEAKQATKEVTDKLSRTPVKALADKAGIDIAYVGVGIVIFSILFVLLGFCGSLVTSLAAFFYPLYRSLKAIRTERDDDDTIWLTYWVVYAFLQLFDNFSEWILAYFPFYYPLKLAFLCWLMVPRTDADGNEYMGAKTLYTSLVRPAYDKNKQSIDDFMKSTTAVLGELTQEFKQALKELVTQNASKIFGLISNFSAKGAEADKKAEEKSS